MLLSKSLYSLAQDGVLFILARLSLSVMAEYEHMKPVTPASTLPRNGGR